MPAVVGPPQGLMNAIAAPVPVTSGGRTFMVPPWLLQQAALPAMLSHAPAAVLQAPGLPIASGGSTNVPTPTMQAAGFREPQGEDPHEGPAKNPRGQRVVGRAAADSQMRENEMRERARRHVDALMAAIGPGTE